MNRKQIVALVISVFVASVAAVHAANSPIDREGAIVAAPDGPVLAGRGGIPGR